MNVWQAKREALKWDIEQSVSEVKKNVHQFPTNICSIFSGIYYICLKVWLDCCTKKTSSIRFQSKLCSVSLNIVRPKSYPRLNAGFKFHAIFLFCGCQLWVVYRGHIRHLQLLDMKNYMNKQHIIIV